MIQRIQTLYLLISEVLVGALFFVPLADLAGKNSTLYRFDIHGIHGDATSGAAIMTALPLVVVLGLSMVLILYSIFQYKKRPQQMVITGISIAMLLLSLGVIWYMASTGAKLVEGTYSLSLFSLFPALAAIFVYLANRAIKRDELLIRSIDRIR